MTDFPARADAEADRALRGVPLTVYLALARMLDPMDWRAVPQLALCARFGLSERSVRDALKLLAELRYIVRDDETHSHTNAPARYRLIYSRRPCPHTATERVYPKGVTTPTTFCVACGAVVTETDRRSA